jgi:hypothetical protein
LLDKKKVTIVHKFRFEWEIMQYEFSSLFSSNNLKPYTCPSGDSGESCKTTPDQVLGSTTNNKRWRSRGASCSLRETIDCPPLVPYHHLQDTLHLYSRLQ